VNNFKLRIRFCCPALVGLVLALLPIQGTARVIYVDGSNTVSGTGESWELAYNNLDSALTSVKHGDEIWVAGAVYYPSLNSMSRSSTFLIPTGVALYGGFSGIETCISERMIELNPTILSGDIGVLGDSLDNCYSVVYLENPDENNVIDGFIVEKGIANDQSPGLPYFSANICGGGLYVLAIDSNSHIKVKNCTFRHNSARQLGGAIFLGCRESYRIFPSLTNCKFENNDAVKGGAICFDRGLDSVVPLFWNCQFYSNHANRGGAITITEAVCEEVVLNSCYFSENSGLRGSVFLFENPIYPVSILINKSILEDNVDLIATGAIEVSGSMANIQLTLDSCFVSNQWEISENGDTIGGNGIVALAYERLKLKIQNTHFNSAGLRLARGRGSVDITNSSVTNCRIHENVLSLHIDTAFLRNVNITNNNSLRPAINGPIYLQVINCNVSNNYTWNVTKKESAIIATDQLWLQNSILWGNDQDTSIGIVVRRFTSKQVLTDFENFSNAKMPDQFGIYIEPEMVELDSILFATDPKFKDSVSGDYHVLSCSPAINFGATEAALMANLNNDLDGLNRVVGSSVDIGPYEHQHPFDISLASIEHISCLGLSDGSVEFTISGVEPVSSYWISDGNSDTNLVNLALGEYIFIFEDEDNCKDTISLTIEEPDSLVVNTTIQNVDCFGSPSGQAQLNINGGTPPYAVEWSNGDTGYYLTNVLAGAYTANIEDSNGCTKAVSLTLHENPALDASWISSAPTSNLTPNGSIHITGVEGGSPPYVLIWGNGYEGLIQDSLYSGTYTLSVFDSLGCFVQYTIALEPINNIDTSEPILIYPNPISRDTKLVIRLISKTSNVLIISGYDALGRSVSVLNKMEQITIGFNEFSYGLDLPYGIYILKLAYGETVIDTFKLLMTSD
jgi:hypothetical protein